MKLQRLNKKLYGTDTRSNKNNNVFDQAVGEPTRKQNIKTKIPSGVSTQKSLTDLPNAKFNKFNNPSIMVGNLKQRKNKCR